MFEFTLNVSTKLLILILNTFGADAVIFAIPDCSKAPFILPIPFVASVESTPKPKDKSPKDCCFLKSSSCFFVAFCCANSILLL